MAKRIGSLAGVAAAFALCFSSTVAAAATTAPVQSVNPLVAVSIFGSPASAQAVCGSVAAPAAGAAAATAAQGQPGCVLPAVDAPPPVADVAPPPPAPRGFGIMPILLGLLGIAALAALIASGNEDGGSPVSP